MKQYRTILLKKRRNDRRKHQSDVPFLTKDVRVYRHPLHFCAHFNRHFAEKMCFVDAKSNRNGPAVIAVVGFPVGSNDWGAAYLPTVFEIQKVKQIQPAKILIVAAAIAALRGAGNF